MSNYKEICWVCADKIKKFEPEFQFLFFTSGAGICDYCGGYSRVNTYESIKPLPRKLVKELVGHE